MRIPFVLLAALLIAPVAAAQTPSSLGSLRSCLKSGDVISVSKMDRQELEGDFVGVSDEELTLMVHGRPLVIAAVDVRDVRRRGRRMVKKGMLFGFVGGAVLADTLLLTQSDAPAGANLFVGTIAGGGAGLIWGAVIGALFHEYPVVYQKPESTVRLLPVLAPHRIGLIATVDF